MTEKKAIDSYPLNCLGADENVKRQHIASVTVYNDGSREVGCDNISSKGQCRGAIYEKCKHLEPVNKVTFIN